MNFPVNYCYRDYRSVLPGANDIAAFAAKLYVLVPYVYTFSLGRYIVIYVHVTENYV